MKNLIEIKRFHKNVIKLISRTFERDFEFDVNVFCPVAELFLPVIKMHQPCFFIYICCPSQNVIYINFSGVHSRSRNKIKLFHGTNGRYLNPDWNILITNQFLFFFIYAWQSILGSMCGFILSMKLNCLGDDITWQLRFSWRSFQEKQIKNKIHTFLWHIQSHKNNFCHRNTTPFFEYIHASCNHWTITECPLTVYLILWHCQQICEHHFQWFFSFLIPLSVVDFDWTLNCDQLLTIVFVCF